MVLAMSLSLKRSCAKLGGAETKSSAKARTAITGMLKKERTRDLAAKPFLDFQQYVKQNMKKAFPGADTGEANSNTSLQCPQEMRPGRVRISLRCALKFTANV